MKSCSKIVGAGLLGATLVFAPLATAVFAQTDDDGVRTTNTRDDDGFDLGWLGLLGLAGLAGLMGRNRHDHNRVVGTTGPGATGPGTRH
jgi:hypothetical protein